MAVAAGDPDWRLLVVSTFVERVLADEDRLDCGVAVANDEADKDGDVAALGLTLGEEDAKSEARADGDEVDEPVETRDAAPDFEASGVDELDETAEPDRSAVAEELALELLDADGAEDVELCSETAAVEDSLDAAVVDDERLGDDEYVGVSDRKVIFGVPEVVLVAAAPVAVLTMEREASRVADAFAETEACADVESCADTLRDLVSLALGVDDIDDFGLADTRAELVAQRVPVDDGELDLEKNDADADALFDGDIDSAGDFDGEDDGNADSETDTDTVATVVIVAEREDVALCVRAADPLLTREPVIVIVALTVAENAIDGDDDAELVVEELPVADSRVVDDALLVCPTLLLVVAESRADVVAEKDDENVVNIEGDVEGDSEDNAEDDVLAVDETSGDGVTVLVPALD